MSDDEYIPLSSIPTTRVDEEYDKDSELERLGIPVYQVQSTPKGTCIMTVGKFLQKPPAVLIHKYDVGPKLRYLITSEIYDNLSLNEAASKCQLGMVRLTANKITNKGTNDETIIPLVCILLSFNTYDHKVKNRDIQQYLSSKDRYLPLDGFWTITLHWIIDGQGKSSILSKHKTYLGDREMINQMVGHLNGEYIKGLVNGLL